MILKRRAALLAAFEERARADGTVSEDEWCFVMQECTA